MNLKVSLVAFLLFLALSLVAFAFSFIGVAGTVIDSMWKLVALDLGISLILGFVYPHVRGVKQGDLLSTNSAFFDNRSAGIVLNMLAGPSAVALQNGRKGDRIKINFQGRNAEGIVVSYAYTFSLATVKVTEMEQPVMFTHQHA